jgi:hypothetical protein
MNAMKTLVRGVLVLVLVGSVVGCGNTIEARVKAVNANRTVSNQGMVSTGVATVILESGTEVQVQMDNNAMREFDGSKSSRMMLRQTSPGQYVFAGMVK